MKEQNNKMKQFWAEGREKQRKKRKETINKADRHKSRAFTDSTTTTTTTTDLQQQPQQ